MTSNLLKALQALLAVLLVVASTPSLRDLLPPHVAAWVVLISGAVAAALGYYTAHRGTMPADPVA